MTSAENLFLNALCQNKTAPQAARAAGFDKATALQTTLALLACLTFQAQHAQALAEADQRRGHLLDCLNAVGQIAKDPKATNKERLQATSQALRLESALKKLPRPFDTPPTKTLTAPKSPFSLGGGEGVGDEGVFPQPANSTISKSGTPSPQGEGAGGWGEAHATPANHTTESTQKPIELDTPSPQGEGAGGWGETQDPTSPYHGWINTENGQPFNPETYQWTKNIGGLYYRDECNVTRMFANPNTYPDLNPAPKYS